MSLGPWFKCYPDSFLKGLSGMTTDEQAFYTQVVMRNYDAGNALYADYKTIAKWCNSNATKARRIIEGLIDQKRLHRLPCGGLIDERALDEMADTCATRTGKVSPKIRKRIAKHALTLANHLQIISKTSPENPLETRSLKEEERRKEKGKTALKKSASILNDGSDAEASAPARESGGGLASTFREEYPFAWTMWRQVRFACSGFHVLSASDLDDIQRGLVSYTDGVFAVDGVDLSAPQYAVLHETAEKHGAVFKQAVRADRQHDGALPALKIVNGDTK